VVSVKYQLDDVLLGHLRQLPCEDILEVEQILQILMVLVVLDDLEEDLIILFLQFGSAIPGHKAQANILDSVNRYLPMHANEVIGLLLLLFHVVNIVIKCELNSLNLQMI
jgi:hypothetical protein